MADERSLLVGGLSAEDAGDIALRVRVPIYELTSETPGLEQIFLPNTAPVDTTAFTLGVVAMYGMAIAVFTTWPKRLLPRKLWHAVHLVAVPVAILTGIHAYLLGTDAKAG